MTVGELYEMLKNVRTVLEMDEAEWRGLPVIVHSDLGAANIKDVVSVHKGSKLPDRGSIITASMGSFRIDEVRPDGA